MDDELKTDISLDFAEDGTIDLTGETGPSEQVSGKENLVQALKLRLMIYRGEVAGLGHPRHGTVIRDLLGQPLTRANLELLRRYVRKAILADPRVERIDAIAVQPRQNVPGAVAVSARVTAVEGNRAEFDFTLDENR